MDLIAIALALKKARAYTDSVALGSGAVQIPGPPGKRVELENDGTHIRWRYVGEDEWVNLISVDSITGVDGINGTSGETPEFRVSENTLQYKFSIKNPTVWTDLYKFTGGSTGGGSEINWEEVVNKPEVFPPLVININEEALSQMLEEDGSMLDGAMYAVIL